MPVYNVNGTELSNIYGCGGIALAEAFDINGLTVYPDEPPTPPEPPVYPTPPDPEYLLDTAVVTPFNATITGTIKQGACTDDEYIYQICFSNNNYTQGKFVKYKISDGTFTETAFDTSISFGHGNDMLYNPNNQHIYVACMTSDGAVIELTNTFEYVQTHYVVGQSGSTYSVWQFCYDRNTNRIYSTNNKDGVVGMSVYDTSFNLLSWFETPDLTSDTQQGCETDGRYIYRVTYNSNKIQVFTVDGTLVKLITNPTSNEPEDLSYNWTAGEYYLNKHGNNAQTFSKIELFSE